MTGGEVGASGMAQAIANGAPKLPQFGFCAKRTVPYYDNDTDLQSGVLVFGDCSSISPIWFDVPFKPGYENEFAVTIKEIRLNGRSI